MINKKPLFLIFLVLLVSVLSAQIEAEPDKCKFSGIPVHYYQLIWQTQHTNKDVSVEIETEPGENPRQTGKHTIEVPEMHKNFSIKYFDSCGVTGAGNCSFDIMIKSFVKSPFVLYDEQGKKVTDGKLDFGLNTITILYDGTFVKKDRHKYTLWIFNDGKSEKVELELRIEYKWPKELDFDTKTGQYDLNLKNERRKVLKYMSKIGLNKKTFIKSGLMNLLAGVAVLFAKSQIERINKNMENRSISTSLDSSKRLFTTFWIGFTVYGLKSIVKAIKRKKSYGDVVDKDVMAIEYNEDLKKQFKNKINKWKEKIIAKISIVLIQKNANMEVK